MKELIDQLFETHKLSHAQFVTLIDGRTQELSRYLFAKAHEVKHRYFGNAVYIRGLLEISNYCKNGCYYCGIRNGNRHASRYRLSAEQIYSCCAHGHQLGFRTFVLQGGEDPFFTDDLVVQIVSTIKAHHPDSAITLSLGEKPYESYRRFRQAGADRYLLRHETADAAHYAQLHPASMSADNRKQCLANLKRLGYQTGSGFMVGSPFQTSQHLATDMLYLHDLQPEMIGIGPFIPHHQTPFASYKAGTQELTLFMLALLRLMLPRVLLPATTALGTISQNGRTLGIQAGANVVMPNLSPLDVRKKYMIYDNKIATGLESCEYLDQLKLEMATIGEEVVVSRGDFSISQGVFTP